MGRAEAALLLALAALVAGAAAAGVAVEHYPGERLLLRADNVLATSAGNRSGGLAFDLRGHVRLSLSLSPSRARSLYFCPPSLARSGLVARFLPFPFLGSNTPHHSWQKSLR